MKLSALGPSMWLSSSTMHEEDGGLSNDDQHHFERPQPAPVEHGHITM